MGLLRETEAGVRALLRSRQWREASRASAGQALPQAVRDQLAFPVALPAPFFRASVHGFHVRRPAAPVSSIRPLLTRRVCASMVLMKQQLPEARKLNPPPLKRASQIAAPSAR